MNNPAKKLLLVEDEALIAMAKKQQLAKLGYIVDHVLTGEAAVSYALDADSRPDLILMDIDLGRGIDGTEAARQILNETDVAVIFLSSHTEPEVVEKTEEITSYGYVVKNSVITVLDASIKMAFKLFEAYRSYNARNQELYAVAEELQQANEELTRTSEELRNNKQRLERSEEEHRRLFETMSPGVVYHSADGTIIAANPAAEAILGLTVDQMNGKTTMDPRWKMVDEAGNGVPGSEHPAMITLRTGNKVGPVDRAVFVPEREEYVWLSITAIPLFNPGETQPYQVYATFEDITERKRAEETVRKSGELFHGSIEALSYPFAVINADTYTVEFANTARGGQDAVGKTCHSVLYDKETPCNDPKHPCPINILRESGQSATVQHVHQDEHGKSQYFEISTYPIFDSDGRLIRIAESQIDVTERKHAEEEVQHRR